MNICLLYIVFQREQELSIVLNDANDNKPIFQQASYDFSYPEVSKIYLIK